MNAVFIATITGLLTALCWGTSDYLSAKSTQKVSTAQVNFGLQLTSIAVVAVIFAFSGLHIHSSMDFFKIALSSLLNNLGFIIFVQALSGGVVGIIVPLGNIYPLFTLSLSMIFLSTRFSALQLSAMAIIVLGALLLAYEKNHKKVPLRTLHRKTFLALLAAVIWGVGFVIVSPVTQVVSWQTITILAEIISLPFSIIFLVLASRGRVAQGFKGALRCRPAIVAGIFGELGLAAFYLGSARGGSVVIPAVLSACGPLVASLWGGLFDHERIGVLKRAGAVVTVLGIIVLNLG